MTWSDAADIVEGIPRRTPMRMPMALGLVMTTALLVTSCGRTPSSTDPGGTTGSTVSAGAAAEGSAAPVDTTSAPATTATGPIGPVEGGEPGLMPEGDGSALAEVLPILDLPQEWRPFPPDGPRYRTEVCGVQLDPVQPADAAQRRWHFKDAQFLESEVHLFASGSDAEEATAAALDATEAVRECPGYGVAEDGSEVAYGTGEYDVTITPVDGAPQGWTAWTETTEQTGMVRHIALAPLPTGWHWTSHVDLLGGEGPTLLLETLPTLPDRTEG
ncbi:hypothetical protein [Ornithinimicrobium sp. Y1694]|uniref:hypothetical protein n=1 Tax=Ornithinimicrobium sp. Y1694 TaxID=3418590 RepID=UPI003CFB8BAC